MSAPTRTSRAASTGTRNKRGLRCSLDGWRHGPTRMRVGPCRILDFTGARSACLPTPSQNDVKPRDDSTIVVTMDDGMVLRCTPCEIGGRRVPMHVRWKLTDANGVEHVGPPYVRGVTPEEVGRLIAGW